MKNLTRIRTTQLHDLVTDIILQILEVDPWRMSYHIVKATAQSHNADVSTLFQVQGDRLVIKGGVVRVDGQWEEITEEVFKKIFTNSAVERTGYKGLKRNLKFLSETS